MLTRPWWLLVAAFVLLAPGAAGAQAPPASDPPIEGMDKLTPEEQARVRQNLERWRMMSPEQRERAVENYRHWRSLGPEERCSHKQIDV